MTLSWRFPQLGTRLRSIELLKLDKRKGATLIAITGIEDSPLYQLSDLALLVKNSNFVDNARFINSQFAMTYIVDIITTLLLDEKITVLNGSNDRIDHQ